MFWHTLHIDATSWSRDVMAVIISALLSVQFWTRFSSFYPETVSIDYTGVAGASSWCAGDNVTVQLLHPAAVKTHVYCAAARLLIASLVICRANRSLWGRQCGYRSVLQLCIQCTDSGKELRLDADRRNSTSPIYLFSSSTSNDIEVQAMT